MSQTLHVVSHTHWDREWYYTFQEFRMRLVDLVDNLLGLMDRDPNYRYFNLDAQTIVLEDYLAIKPYNRERLEKYIREGRITVGPWYQLNDEFLTSGEATVRSLLVGTRIARQFGPCMKIGYLPDQFGNLSQMPQILRGFGIDNAVMGRGRQLVGDRKMEFLWESPDGSQVTASLMAFWYNNAQNFPAEPGEALRYAEGIRNTMSPHAAVSHLLLMNGVDHLEPQQNLSPILAALEPLLPEGVTIRHSTLPQYIEAVQKEVAEKKIALEVQRGELREDRGGSCLAGVLSTRMYLKQANHHSQNVLEKYAEPFSSFAMQAGREYDYDFLHYAWKLLMQNHPHDSICGCSVDQVHAEMMPRFQQADQIGEKVVERTLAYLADRVNPDPSKLAGEGADAVPAEVSPFPVSGANEPGKGVGGLGDLLVVFNPLNWTRTDPVISTLVFPLGIPTRGNPPRDDAKQVSGFSLRDENGAEMPFAVTNVEVKPRQVLSPVELPLDQWVQEISIEFVAHDVPACGYKSYRIVPQSAMPQYAPFHTDLSVESGRFLFEDVGDVGDEYLHRKPLNDERIVGNPKDGQRRQAGNSVRCSREYNLTMSLPESSDLMRRTVARADSEIGVKLVGWKDVPRTELTISVDNRSTDHRLRALFSVAGEKKFVAESAFDAIERPAVHPLEGEGALPFHPQLSWVDAGGAKLTLNGKTLAPGGKTIINRGLPEYEVYNEETFGPDHRQVAVTLLRSVGFISRRGDGPQLDTPDAQCLGKHTFELAVYRHEGDWQEAKVWKQAHQFNVPLRAIQTTVLPRQTRDFPPSNSFVTVEPDSLVVTAIKRAEDDPNTLIVRFFNITDEPVVGGRVTVQGAKSAALVNLNEEAQETLAMNADSSVALPAVRAKQIVTLAFRLA